MRILVVGAHPNLRQGSMSLFAQWLVDAAKPLGEVELTQAPARLLTASRKASRVAKWLAYVDQYILLTLKLWAVSRRFDVIVVADQGNAPSAALVPRRKLMIMIHDTIAMRQALGQVPSAPPVKLGGKVLQFFIRRAVRRARRLMSNPGAIPGEIERLGLGRNASIVGCPADYSRLQVRTEAPLAASPYILNVAGDGWRKRKTALVPLWKEVQARSPLKLVLAGYTDEQTSEAFLAAGLPAPIILNDLPDVELANLYKNCEALISVSHEEGLCIPILEALHFNKRVFTPDLSPSYVDFFGSAVTRLDFNDPATAAEELLKTLPTPLDVPAIHAVQAWAEPAAFKQRVVQALSAKPVEHDQLS